ncbi:hypothetical protein [Capnocytophaga stomatis]|uniref:Uncharacterized protein n=1 Tax=Capnocytophaga stomatis TaxID=1848904 RepID=A0ABW8QEH6_9FLAO|nr:hypothetical protein [Capnocytophaga stomatis]
MGVVRLSEVEALCVNGFDFAQPDILTDCMSVTMLEEYLINLIRNENNN